MALYHWIKFLVGLWIVWFVFTIIGVINGYMFSIVDKVITETQPYLPIPQNMLDVITMLSNTYVMIFNVSALIVFGAMILYLYINSARRDVDEYMVAY